MTSTPSDTRPVFLEFPNFGYGPASTLLTLVGALGDRFRWHVVSTGGAVDFLRAQLPGAAVHDLDTFTPTAWPAFRDIAAPGSLIISATNPEFAAWAIRQGYRVGLIDTLDWMWPDLPEVLNDAEFHLVQAYFGASRPRPGPRREIVRPIVDPALWPAASPSPRPRTALIGLGGMHLPGRDELVATYVRWLLRTVLPILLDHGTTEITIAGGRADLPDLVPARWRTHSAITTRPGMDRRHYARAVHTAEHVIASPGLASIYECAASRLTPLWQPGYSMSMLLQCGHLQATGYPYVADWPWLDEATDHIAGLPEAEGLRYVDERITATIHDIDPDGETVGKALLHYLEQRAASHYVADDAPLLHLPLDPDLPDGAALLAAHLGRLL